MSSPPVLDALCASPGRPKARQHDPVTVLEAASPKTARLSDSINACRREDAFDSDSPTVRLVMVFSNYTALHPVLDAHQMICRQLQPECRVEESWWNFHALAHPSLREVTVADAARADIILIALHNATDPLWMLRAWVDAWSNRRATDDGALVLMLPTPSAKAGSFGSTEEYLRQAARMASMDFFVNAPPISMTEQGCAPSGLAAKLPYPSESTRCWGINE